MECGDSKGRVSALFSYAEGGAWYTFFMSMHRFSRIFPLFVFLATVSFVCAADKDPKNPAPVPAPAQLPQVIPPDIDASAKLRADYARIAEFLRDSQQFQEAMQAAESNNGGQVNAIFNPDLLSPELFASIQAARNEILKIADDVLAQNAALKIEMGRIDTRNLSGLISMPRLDAHKIYPTPMIIDKTPSGDFKSAPLFNTNPIPPALSGRMPSTMKVMKAARQRTTQEIQAIAAMNTQVKNVTALASAINQADARAKMLLGIVFSSGIASPEQLAFAAAQGMLTKPQVQMIAAEIAERARISALTRQPAGASAPGFQIPAPTGPLIQNPVFSQAASSYSNPALLFNQPYVSPVTTGGMIKPIGVVVPAPIYQMPKMLPGPGYLPPKLGF